MYICVKELIMVKSKIDLFSQQLTDDAQLFKVLGHPARLQILQFLSETSNCITGDISDHLPLSRTTVNQHIKELKNIGLIQGQVQGIKTNYCLNTEKLHALKKALQSFLDQLKINEYVCE